MLPYILAAGALLAVIAAAFGGGNSSGAATRLADNQGQRIASQAHLIAGELSACTVNYPTGLNGTAYRATYPAALTTTNIETLTCPGKPAGVNALFATLGSASAPPALNGFVGWRFINDATSARLVLDANDANGVPGLLRSAQYLGPQASVTGQTLTFTIQQ